MFRKCYLAEIEGIKRTNKREMMFRSFKTFLNKISKIIAWCVFLIYNYYYSFAFIFVASFLAKDKRLPRLTAIC